jgi:HTH-type transcriptional regulator/antitoxin HigA
MQIQFEGFLNMTLPPIKTEEEYDRALVAIDLLMDAEPNSPEEMQLLELGEAIEAYESVHYPIDPPEPIESIRYYLESRDASLSAYGKAFPDKLRDIGFLSAYLQLALENGVRLNKPHLFIQALEDALEANNKEFSPVHVALDRIEGVTIQVVVKQKSKSVRVGALPVWRPLRKLSDYLAGGSDKNKVPV